MVAMLGDRARDRRRPAGPRRRAAVLRRVPGAALRGDGPPDATSSLGLLLFLAGVARPVQPVRRTSSSGSTSGSTPSPTRSSRLPDGPGAVRVRTRRPARRRASARACPTIGGRRRSPPCTRTTRSPRIGEELGPDRPAGDPRACTSSSSSEGCGSPPRRTTTSGRCSRRASPLVVGVQAFIIAAGNLKLIPLTGITLPFISYGGSSLLANALVVGLLLALSDRGAEPPAAPREPASTPSARFRHGRHRVSGPWRPQPHGARRGPPADRPNVFRTGIAITLAFAILAVGAGYWQVVEAQRLSDGPRQPRRHRDRRRALRGPIEDRNGRWLARSTRDDNGEATARVPGRHREPRGRVRVAAVRDHGPRAHLQRGAAGPVRARTRGRPAPQVRRRPDQRRSGSVCPSTCGSSGRPCEASGKDAGAVVMLDPRPARSSRSRRRRSTTRRRSQTP